MKIKRVAKAIASAFVGAAAYLVGVIPAEGGFGDVSVIQWLGLIVFIGAGYGITWSVSNSPPAAPRRDTPHQM